MQILLYSGFYPIIYGKMAAFAIAKIFLKILCPGNYPYRKIYRDGKKWFSVI